MTHRASTIAAVVLVLLSGCAENAILELELTLPPKPDTGDWFAVTQIRTGDWAFELFGPPAPTDAPAVALQAAPTLDCISVISGDDTVDLHVRVRFCQVDDCSSFADNPGPEARFRLAHPFYIGRRTKWDTSFGAVPATVGSPPTEAVDACDIQGCIEGESVNYCREMGRGSHLCVGGPNTAVVLGCDR